MPDLSMQVGRDMYRRAGELGVPVAYMAFKGLLLHIEDIEELAEDFPGTRVILDHFAFVQAGMPNSAEWSALLRLARYPQVLMYPSTLLADARRNFLQQFV